VTYPYAFGALTAIAGTVAVTASSSTVTGTGTTLSANFPEAGAPIVINGIWRRGGYFGSLPSPPLADDRQRRNRL
jgi:hypothetical protein